MKVLHLITSTRSFFEQRIHALESHGVDCTVVGVPGEYSADSPRSPIDYLRYYPRVLKAVRSADYDVVHAHYGLVAPFALAQPTRPVVLTLWGTDLMSERRWLRSISRWGARHADVTVLPSPAMSEELSADHELIPFGVDTDLFTPMPRPVAREKVGWETDRPIALFPYDPARPEKDYSRAERLVERADADVELRTVTGVPHERMPAYVNASDVLLLTSTRESGPMVVREAAACAVPVVSTDVGFVAETVGDAPGCVVSDDDRDLIAGLEAVADGHQEVGEPIDVPTIEETGAALCACYERLLEENRTDSTPVRHRANGRDETVVGTDGGHERSGAGRRSADDSERGGVTGRETGTGGDGDGVTGRV